MSLGFVFSSLVFIIYTQSPLFTSNQNQYFLHGMANANIGYLENDWLAQTFDPTPAFSLLVQIVYTYANPFLFYFIAAALLALYFFSLIKITTYIHPSPPSSIQSLIFITLLLLVHSALWRYTISRLIGPQWSYILEDGFAGQRLLGPVLQPSFFGILLLTSILAFLQKRYFLAILLSVISASIHPTYLLSAGSLVFSYIYVFFNEGKFENFRLRFIKKSPFILGMIFFAIISISPILIYTISNFVSTPIESTQAARHILVTFRIPHHAIIIDWFDTTSVVKILLLIAGIILARKTRLFHILLIPATIGMILTIGQIISKSNFLALLFPWRISTFLIPISTALFLYKISGWIVSLKAKNPKKREFIYTITCLICLILISIVGTIRLFLDFQRKAKVPEIALFSYINTTKQPTDIYLIPIKMQDFRLATGAPAYVDFKAIPYQDQDVLEWYRRIKKAEKVYSGSNCNEIQEFLTTEKVSHIVIKQGELEDRCTNLTKEYETPDFSLFQVISR
jgi:hypothetical protein